MEFKDKCEVLKTVTGFLAVGSVDDAKKVALEQYPFTAFDTFKRSYTPTQSVQVFARDGFIDRYSGQRLINPGVLRLLSIIMPDEFPAHSNWKMNETHIMYWELFPTVDHLLPIALGGEDNETNWICTSMLRNSAKANWRLEEIGWQLFDPGNVNEWDGLSRFFLAYIEQHPEHLANTYLRTWHRATKTVFTALDQ